jgi:hypothetical protein
MARSRTASLLIAALCAIFSCGCSLLFVTSPPKHVEKLPPSEPVECTTNKLAPVIDTLVTGFQVYRTIYAAQASNGDYAGLPISRSTDIVLGSSLTALFLVSAAYGYKTTDQCIDAKAAHAAYRRRQTRPAEPRAVPDAPPPTNEVTQIPPPRDVLDQLSERDASVLDEPVREAP